MIAKLLDGRGDKSSAHCSVALELMHHITRGAGERGVLSNGVHLLFGIDTADNTRTGEPDQGKQ